MYQTNDERRTLKRFLSQYFRARGKQGVLQRRLATIRAELKNPSLGSSAFDGMPRGNQISEGAAALTYKIAEIEDRIQRQSELEATALLEVMNLLDLLPLDSTERHIMELRHIDCKSWKEVTKIVFMGRTACTQYYNAGIETLLGMDAVKEILTQTSQM